MPGFKFPMILVESEAIKENYRAKTSEIPEIRRLTDLVLNEKYKNQEVLNIMFNHKLKSRLSKGKFYELIFPTREEWNERCSYCQAALKTLERQK